jgi:adenylate cyclase
MSDVVEIERKFLLRALPPRELLGRGAAIAQGYLPGGLRLRRWDDLCFMTLKGEGNLARAEWEVEMPRWAFDRLWPLTEKRRLEKTRYEVPHGELTLEVDEYHGTLRGLWVLECEFASEAAAHAFTLPAWAASAVDVTADVAYRNSSLSIFGIPEGAVLIRE